VFPAVSCRSGGFDVEALAAFPGSMLPNVRVALPESPVTVTVQVVICKFPLFLMVAAIKVFEPALMMSTDCIWTSNVELIVLAMLENRAYTVNPADTVIDIKIMVAIRGLTPRLLLSHIGFTI